MTQMNADEKICENLRNLWIKSFLKQIVKDRFSPK